MLSTASPSISGRRLDMEEQNSTAHNIKIFRGAQAYENKKNEGSSYNVDTAALHGTLIQNGTSMKYPTRNISRSRSRGSSLVSPNHNKQYPQPSPETIINMPVENKIYTTVESDVLVKRKKSAYKWLQGEKQQVILHMILT